MTISGSKSVKKGQNLLKKRHKLASDYFKQISHLAWFFGIPKYPKKIVILCSETSKKLPFLYPKMF